MAGKKPDPTYPVSIVLGVLALAIFNSTQKTNFCFFNVGKHCEMGKV